MANVTHLKAQADNPGALQAVRGDQQPVWLKRYFEARAQLDALTTEQSPGHNGLCEEVNRLEGWITGTPATSPAAVIAKLFVAAQINADGGSLTAEQSQPLVDEAMAYLYPQEPIMLDRSSWEAALAAHASSMAAVAAFDRDHLSPASDHYTAVRSQWPVDHDWQSDENATQAIEAASAEYDPFQSEFDSLVSTSWDALAAMLEVPAPDMAAVRHKLAALVEREVWPLAGPETFFAVLLADLTRLEGQA